MKLRRLQQQPHSSQSPKRYRPRLILEPPQHPLHDLSVIPLPPSRGLLILPPSIVLAQQTQTRIDKGLCSLALRTRRGIDGAKSSSFVINHKGIRESDGLTVDAETAHVEGVAAGGGGADYFGVGAGILGEG